MNKMVKKSIFDFHFSIGLLAFSLGSFPLDLYSGRFFRYVGQVYFFRRVCISKKEVEVLLLILIF
jgi:hypothetical protein